MSISPPPSVEVFAKTLDHLIQMVVRGRVNLEIGRGIGQELHNDPAVAHVANVFWGMTINAHLDAVQLIAFKLFDKQSNMTVEHLLEMAEYIKPCFRFGPSTEIERYVSEARAQIVEIEKSLKPIRAKRNRVLAHTDQTIAIDPVKVAEAVRVTFADLDKVLSTAEIILNDFSVALRDSSPDYKLIDTDDYKMVIARVADAQCAIICDYEKRFGPWEYDNMRPKKCQKADPK